MLRIKTRRIEGEVRMQGRFPAGGKWPLLFVDHPALKPGEGAARVSLNFLVPPQTPTEVCIKNYSENIGVLSELVRVRVVLPPHRVQQVDDGVEHPVCHMTPEFLARYEPAVLPPKQALPAHRCSHGVLVTDPCATCGRG